jgi:two-component system sensor histidine kinase/response regulator
MTADVKTGRDRASETDARIRAEQIRVFHNQANTALVGNLLAVLATVALLWDRVEQDHLTIWAGVTAAFVFVRLLIYRRFDPEAKDTVNIARWGRRFTIFAFVSGLCWGALPGVFFETADPFVPIYIVCVVAGLLVGALGALSAHGPAYRAYIIAMVAPLVLRCLFSGATDYMIIGGLVAFALLTSIRFGAVWERTLRDQIRLRLDAETLLNAAETARGALNESEQRLGAILEASPIGVSVLSAWSGQRVFVNKALMDQFGASDPGEITNIPVQDSWVNQEDYQYALDMGSGAEALTNFVAPRRRLDGSVWWALHNNVQLIFEGEPARVVWHTDITQSKQAEEEIRASEARLRGLLESSPIGVGVLDRAGGILFANSRYSEIFGFDETQIVGFNAATLVVDPDRRAEMLNDLSSTGRFSDALVELRGPGGMSFWGLISGEMIDFQGQRAILTWTYDIDERVRMESVLQAAKEEAEAANRAKSSFLAAMSHEIRTPMNGVLGMIEVLRQSPLTDDQRSITSTIQESAVGLLTIIDDILDFSKIEASRLDLEAVPVQLRPLMESVLDIVTPEIEDKGLDLALLVDDAVPTIIRGDPTRLRQILLNLTGNAVKFTETGWIGVFVSLDNSLETVGQDGNGNHVLRISVEDTGIGISPERQAGLFQAFSQAESSTTRRFGGTGLGLSISARLVELMDGEIGVESDEGDGSTFWFTLPVHPIEMSDAPTPQSVDLSDISVLVVERIEPVRRMMASLLASQGCEVTTVATSGEATAQVDRRTDQSAGFDVLILDRLDDNAAVTALRRHFHVPTTTSSDRVIMVCSSADGSPSPGIRVEVTRPVRRASLLRSMATVLGRLSPDVPAIHEGTEVDAVLAPPDIEDALARGQLILVAEDNATNREVILRQLNLLGFAAEVAEDGAVAFDMWARRAYGLLVTDCHMPNKDGFELTRMVRDVERELGTHTPIIALTANALAGEAERCLNAGMDDYLAKPVGLRKLRETLTRWLVEAPVSPADLNGIVTPSLGGAATDNLDENTMGSLDPSVLGELFGEDRDGMREMMELFLDNAERLVVEMDAAIKARDGDAVSRAGHGLKGAAYAIGVNVVGDLALTLENLGRNGDLERCDQRRVELGVALDEARAFIRAF